MANPWGAAGWTLFGHLGLGLDSLAHWYYFVRLMELSGVGLFSGKRCTVRLSRRDGPSGFALGPGGAQFLPFSEMLPEAALLSTSVRAGAFVVRTVEHCFAAIAAHGVHEGLCLSPSDVELPLLDGTAAPWSHALLELGIAASPARCRVVRAFEVTDGPSTYTFRPSGQTHVSCVLRTDDRRLAKEASWSGSANDFHERIAVARTFAFARDLDAYARLGAEVHLDPADVIVIGDEIYSYGRAFQPDEPVRHKLLDLMGDLFAHGGPPMGEIHAVAPGHARTHAAIAIAKSKGVIVSS